MTHKNLVLLILLAALWGASFVFLKLGAPVFGAGVLIEIRVLSAALFVLAVAAYLGRKLDWRGHVWHYSVMGFLNLALPFTLFAYAAHTLDASLLSVINSSVPIFAALLSVIWLKAKLTPSILFGLALGVIGVIVLSWEGLHQTDEVQWWPLLASLIAAACYAIASVYAKKVAKSIHPFDNAHGTLWAASILVIPFALTIPIEQSPVTLDWIWALALGVLSTGFAFILYFKLIEEEGPMQALSVTFIIPLFGILWGALFLGERPSSHLLFGGILVLLAIAFTNRLLSFSQLGFISKSKS